MTSPVTARAREYVRSRIERFQEYECRIERVAAPTYDETTLRAVGGSRDTLYEGPCRLWAVSGSSLVMVTENDFSQQDTMLSIPWDVDAVIKRHDEVKIISANTDSQVVGLRFEIQSIEKAGELRATRRFQVTLVQDQR